MNKEIQEQNLALKIWDFYRIAPFGETIVVFEIMAAVFEIMAAIQVFQHTENIPIILITSALLAMGVLTGVVLAKRQFDLKTRLENALLKYGYSDKIFELFVSEWCARQTALVVAEEYGYKENLLKFYKLHVREMNLRFLPNF